MVEGIVDLAFLERDCWHVVDFKTDRELSAAHEQQYRKQIALYARASAQATSQSSAGYLVRV